MALEPERRKVAALGALVACMAAPGAVFPRRFPRFEWVWLALMIVVLIPAMIQLAKLKRK